MEPPEIAYDITPLGDMGMLISFGNRIEESINTEVIRRAAQLSAALPDITDVVPAYSSITVSFDFFSWKKRCSSGELAFDLIKRSVEDILLQPYESVDKASRLVRIPVCYDGSFASDIKVVASTNNISIEDVIALHLSSSYRVYMLGFLPGFSYLGEVDEKIATPRKSRPVQVEAGSIGIAGKQTGIYPLASPGGWQIIGRTPIKLFNAEDSHPTLLQPGDTVEFFQITQDIFQTMSADSIAITHA